MTFMLFVLYRLAYAVYLLELLMKMYPNHKIQLMYDIACLLCKHLQVFFIVHVQCTMAMFKNLICVAMF